MPYLLMGTLLLISFLLICYLIFKLRRLQRIKIGSTISGIAIKVGDGDGFKFIKSSSFMICCDRLIHNDPISIRLAGIDAPEVRCFGRPEQPFAKESMEKLKKLILNKRVTIKILDIDRYNRFVAMVFLKKGLFRKMNVNLEMIRNGMACVYKGKYVSFDDLESIFYYEETKAKNKKIGIWSDSNFIHPQEYKRLNRY